MALCGKIKSESPAVAGGFSSKKAKARSEEPTAYFLLLPFTFLLDEATRPLPQAILTLPFLSFLLCG